MGEFTTFTVTCHTVDCGNGQQAIEVLAPETDPLVICGVCSEPITDVTPSGALS